MRPGRRLIFASGLLAACTATAVSDSAATREIADLLHRSAADWNAGDLAGFMSDYAPDSLTSFVAGRGVLYGWQTLYDRYASGYFGPGKTRDSLAFDALRVRTLAPRVALATAHFALWRRDSVVASGPFTLILEQRDGRWLIIHDHTSADPRP